MFFCATRPCMHTSRCFCLKVIAVIWYDLSSIELKLLWRHSPQQPRARVGTRDATQALGAVQVSRPFVLLRVAAVKGHGLSHTVSQHLSVRALCKQRITFVSAAIEKPAVQP
jgi:hypothetical protein